MVIERKYITITNSVINDTVSTKYLTGCYLFNTKTTPYTSEDITNLSTAQSNIVKATGQSYLSQVWVDEDNKLYINAMDYYARSNNIPDTPLQTNKTSIALLQVLTVSKYVSGDGLILHGTDGLYSIGVDSSRVHFIAPPVNSDQIPLESVSAEVIYNNMVYTTYQAGTYGARVLRAVNLNPNETLEISTSGDTPFEDVLVTTYSDTATGQSGVRCFPITDGSYVAQDVTDNGVKSLILNYSINRQLCTHNLYAKYTYPDTLSSVSTGILKKLTKNPISRNNPLGLKNPSAVAIMYDFTGSSQKFFELQTSVPEKFITVKKSSINGRRTSYASPYENLYIDESLSNPTVGARYEGRVDVIIISPDTSTYTILEDQKVNFEYVTDVVEGSSMLIYGHSDSTKALVSYSISKNLSSLGYTTVFSVINSEDSTSISGLGKGEFLIRSDADTLYNNIVTDTPLSTFPQTLPSFEGTDYLKNDLYSSINGRTDVLNTTNDLKKDEILLLGSYNGGVNRVLSLGSYYLYPNGLDIETNLLTATERPLENDVIMI